MPYATGETPQIGDVVERLPSCAYTKFWKHQKTVKGFNATHLFVEGDAADYPCWSIGLFRLIRRKTDVTKLDTSGVFDEAKPASEAKAVRWPRRARHFSFMHRGWYVEQKNPGDSWLGYSDDGTPKPSSVWTGDKGCGFIADGTWIETFDHHATAAPLPADGPQVKEAAAPEAKDEWPKSFAWDDDPSDVITFYSEKDVPRCKSGRLWVYPLVSQIKTWVPIKPLTPSPELAAAMDEIERLTKERDALADRIEIGERYKRELWTALEKSGDEQISLKKQVEELQAKLSAARAALGAV